MASKVMNASAIRGGSYMAVMHGLVGRSLSSFVSLFMLALLARLLSADSFGAWNIAWAVAIGIAFVIEGGAGTALLTRLPANNPVSWGSIVRSRRLVFAALTLGTAAGVGLAAFTDSILALVPFQAIGLVSQRFAAEVARADQRYAAAALTDGFASAAVTAMALLLFKSSSPTLAAVTYGSAGLCFSLAAIAIREHRCRRTRPERLTLELGGAGTVAASDFSRYVTTQLDVLVVAAIADPATAGIYAAGKRVALTVGAFQAVVAGAARGRLPLALQSEDDSLARSEFRRLTLISVSVIGTAAFACALLSRQIVTSLYGSGYANASSILVILLLPTIVSAATGPSGTYLALHRLLRPALVRISVGGTAVGLPAMFLGGHFWGAGGVALGMALALAAMNVGQWMVARKHLVSQY